MAEKSRVFIAVLVLSWLAVGYLVYENRKINEDVDRLKSDSVLITDLLTRQDGWRETNWEAVETAVDRIDALEQCSREHSSWIRAFMLYQELPISMPRGC